MALDFDSPGIAVTSTGARIWIIPGEGFNADCFAGELLEPTEHQMLGGAHVSALWDKAKVVRIEPGPPYCL